MNLMDFVSKETTLHCISSLADDIGERDIARLAKVKELCMKFSVDYDSYIKILTDYQKWEESHD